MFQIACVVNLLCWDIWSNSKWSFLPSTISPFQQKQVYFTARLGGAFLSWRVTNPDYNCCIFSPELGKLINYVKSLKLEASCLGIMYYFEILSLQKSLTFIGGRLEIWSLSLAYLNLALTEWRLTSWFFPKQLKQCGDNTDSLWPGWTASPPPLCYTIQSPAWKNVLPEGMWGYLASRFLLHPEC